MYKLGHSKTNVVFASIEDWGLACVSMQFDQISVD